MFYDTANNPITNANLSVYSGDTILIPLRADVAAGMTLTATAPSGCTVEGRLLPSGTFVNLISGALTFASAGIVDLQIRLTAGVTNELNSLSIELRIA
jgi:hypothetical protein